MLSLEKILSDFHLIDQKEALVTRDLLNRMRNSQKRVISSKTKKFEDEINELFTVFYFPSKKRSQIYKFVSNLIKEFSLSKEEKLIIENLTKYGIIDNIRLESFSVLLVSPEGIAFSEALNSFKTMGNNIKIDIEFLKNSLTSIELKYRETARIAIKRIEKSVEKRYLTTEQIGAIILILLLGAIGEKNAIDDLLVMHESFENYVKFFHRILDKNKEADHLEKRIFRGRNISNFLSEAGFMFDYSLKISKSQVYIKEEKLDDLIKIIIDQLIKSKSSSLFWENWSKLRNKSLEIRANSPNLVNRFYDMDWDKKLDSKIQNNIFGRNTNDFEL